MMLYWRYGLAQSLREASNSLVRWSLWRDVYSVRVRSLEDDSELT
jgi:hypothetical protein